MKPKSARSRFWPSILLVSVLSIVSVELVLLNLATGLFSGGFGATGRPRVSQTVYYVVGAALLDAWLILGTWSVAHWIFRRFGGGPVRCASLGLTLAIAPSILFAIVKYRVHVILGGIVESRLLSGSASSLSDASRTYLQEWMPGMDAFILAGACLGMFIIPLWARRFEASRHVARVEIPRLSTLVSACAAAGSLGVLSIAGANAQDGFVQMGFERKASGTLVMAGIRSLTDWDRDGFGWLSRPSDPDPFDGSIYPYAIEIPGNGIDENGFGGDRPIDFVAPIGGSAFATRGNRLSSSSHGESLADHEGERRPHLLFIFLESFRPELLDMVAEGRPVTPFLSRLAKQGGTSARTFVHSPWTLQSRDQLFRGHLVDDHSSSTLFDDFFDRGYFVAHFSGQDDSYGNSIEDLGLGRADLFYDARQDLDRRTSRSTVPVSLQVSWKTVTSRVVDFLDSYGGDKPLLLYVNLVDTHFPYTHHEIDTVVGSSELARDEIRAENAEQIFRAYANTAANVDLAAELVFDEWDTKFSEEDRAILVVADHGEAFYENGTLGHGQTIEGLETRVPLITFGVGGEWPEPIAISDLRALIGANLFEKNRAESPVFTTPKGKRLFQFLGPIMSPSRIAMRSLERTVVLDLKSGQSWLLDANDERLDDRPRDEELRDLIWHWEWLQERNQSSQDASVDRGGAG